MIAVEPDEPLHGLEGLKHLPTRDRARDLRPAASRTRRSAWPPRTATALCREVLASDGLLVGHSAGAALWAAREVARALTAGVVVVLLPDGGERYLGDGCRARRPAARWTRCSAHARRGYPFEVCGVLVGRPDGARRGGRRRSTNRETEPPRVRYQIAPEDLIRIQREARERGREILGYYHSHPDHPARPSETDRRIAAEGLSDGVIHVVVGRRGRRPRRSPTAWVFRDADQAFDEEPFEIV